MLFNSSTKMQNPFAVSTFVVSNNNIKQFYLIVSCGKKCYVLRLRSLRAKTDVFRRVSAHPLVDYHIIGSTKHTSYKI